MHPLPGKLGPPVNLITVDRDLGRHGPPTFSWGGNGVGVTACCSGGDALRRQKIETAAFLGQSALRRAGSPWLWEGQETSTLVFVPGMISPLAHRKPGLGASDLSWDGQTRQRGQRLVTGQEASGYRTVRHHPCVSTQGLQLQRLFHVCNPGEGIQGN